MSIAKLYPLEWYGVRNTKAGGLAFNPQRCAGEINMGFGTRRQCTGKPGHGERSLFCPKHAALKARPEGGHE